MALKKFKANTKKSLIKWTGKKVTGVHAGTVNLSSGNLEVEDGQIVGGEFDIDTRSIVVTDIEDAETNAQFAGHLFSDDFFAVEKFPAVGEIIVDRTKYDIKFRSGNFFKNLGDNLIYNDFKLHLTLVALLN